MSELCRWLAEGELRGQTYVAFELDPRSLAHQHPLGGALLSVLDIGGLGARNFREFFESFRELGGLRMTAFLEAATDLRSAIKTALKIDTPVELVPPLSGGGERIVAHFWEGVGDEVAERYRSYCEGAKPGSPSWIAEYDLTRDPPIVTIRGIVNAEG
jgi:hypothetical protein